MVVSPAAPCRGLRKTCASSPELRHPAELFVFLQVRTGTEAFEMLFTVRSSSMSLGSVDLPTGILVAARLRPSSEYGAVAEIVRAASEAFLHLGLFDAVAPMLPPIPLVRRQWRRALSHAARLQLVLEGPDGTRASTDFVNLLEAPADHDVIVLASFVSAHSRVGAPLLTPSVELGPGNLPDSGTWDVML